jgi:nucleotide-binding universal stress UspA family protein
VSYQRILVALDGSPLAEQILPHVIALAEKFDATLMLVRAMTPVEQLAAVITPSMGGAPLDPTIIDDMRASEEREATTYLEHVARGLRERGIKVACERPIGPPAQAILAVARSHEADLIALTTHGRTGLGRLVFGSVAADVLRRATDPILLVRAQDTRS